MRGARDIALSFHRSAAPISLFTTHHSLFSRFVNDYFNFLPFLLRRLRNSRFLLLLKSNRRRMNILGVFLYVVHRRDSYHTRLFNNFLFLFSYSFVYCLKRNEKKEKWIIMIVEEIHACTPSNNTIEEEEREQWISWIKSESESTLLH